MSANVDLIRAIYDAFAAGDVPGILGRMDPAVEWHEAENFPYADNRPYVGPEAVAQGVFLRCATEWDGFGVQVDEIVDGGDTVVALGRRPYTGAAGILRAARDSGMGVIELVVTVAPLASGSANVPLAFSVS